MLGYYISATITEVEVKEIQSEIEAVIQKHGGARLLCQIGDLSVPEADASSENLKFTPEYLKGLERFALIGDSVWHRWVTELADRLNRAEARYFETSQREQAWAWIQR